MKIKYLGLAPVTTALGSWVTNQVKEVEPKDYDLVPSSVLFRPVKEAKPPTIIKKKKVVYKERLQDKMERNDTLLINPEEDKKDDSKKRV